MAVKIAAKGNATGFRSTKTPAPDEVTNIRAPGQAGYGQNGPQPSSVAPGKRVVSQLGANLESSVDDDGVRDTIINRGLARDPSVGDGTDRTFPMQPSTTGGFQAGAAGDEMLRDIADGGRSGKGRVAVHSSMAPRGVDEGSPGGPVPGATDAGATANPARKPQ